MKVHGQSTLSGDEFPNEGNPILKAFLAEAHLRLVVSVDLSGSTNIKTQLQPDVKDPWVLEIERFYKEFPIILKHGYERSPTYCGREPFQVKDRLKVFKFQGDEILFCVELTRHQQTATHLHAVKWAVRHYNNPSSLLPCKATAWICGTPVTDYAINVEFSNGLSVPPDIVGPSMDLGYRLSGLAEPRKILVSYDLALMLIHGIENLKHHETGFYFYFDGCQALKGVMGGFPYPIIWINVYDQDHPAEELLKGESKKPADVAMLRKFCECFREQHLLEGWFIKSDPDPRYCGPNDYWLQKYVALKSLRLKMNDQRANGGSDCAPAKAA